MFHHQEQNLDRQRQDNLTQYMADKQAFVGISNSCLKFSHLGEAPGDVFRKYKTADMAEDALLFFKHLENCGSIEMRENGIAAIVKIYDHVRLCTIASLNDVRLERGYLYANCLFPGIGQALDGFPIIVQHYRRGHLANIFMDAPKIMEALITGHPHSVVKDLETWKLAPMNSGMQIICGRKYNEVDNEKTVSWGFLAEVQYGPNSIVGVKNLYVYTGGPMLGYSVDAEDISDVVMSGFHHMHERSRSLQACVVVRGCTTVPAAFLKARFSIQMMNGTISQRSFNGYWRGGAVNMPIDVSTNETYFERLMPRHFQNRVDVRFVAPEEIQNSVHYVRKSGGILRPDWLFDVSCVPLVNEEYCPRRPQNFDDPAVSRFWQRVSVEKVLTNNQSRNRCFLGNVTRSMHAGEIQLPLRDSLTAERDVETGKFDVDYHGIRKQFLTVGNPVIYKRCNFRTIDGLGKILPLADVNSQERQLRGRVVTPSQPEDVEIWNRQKRKLQDIRSGKVSGISKRVCYNGRNYEYDEFLQTVNKEN